MYFNAKDSPVSFLSTIRTFPNAPRPTTRRRRKWFKFTAHGDGTGQLWPLDFRRRQRARTEADRGRRQRGGRGEGREFQRLTFAVEFDGLALAVSHGDRGEAIRQMLINLLGYKTDNS